ncbi:MAG: hypothetical protein R3F03_02140 [Opitutaceae bacterium]
MYRLSLLCVFCFWIAATSRLAALSPHPCVLQLVLENERPTVVGIKGNDPLYMRGGKIVRDRNNDKYEVGRAKHYADGHIKITNLKGSQIIGSGSHGGFKVSMTADRTLRNNFIVIIVYNSGFLTTGSWANALYFVRKLPDLPAGKEVTTEIVTYGDITGGAQGLLGADERRFFPIIFTEGGLEVQNDKWEEIAAYYLRVNLNMHAMTRARYLQAYQDKDHQIAAFYTPNPVLPSGATKPSEPINAVLDVDQNGYVTAVAISSKIDSKTETVVQDALKEWLFLPRLKGGNPVPVRVEAPVAF